MELLPDIFGQSNKFQKLNKKKFGDFQQMTPHRPKTCFQSRHQDVFETPPQRQFRTCLGQSNRVFRGRPVDVGGGRPRDVLGTNICRLGRQCRKSLYVSAMWGKLLVNKFKWTEDTFHFNEGFIKNYKRMKNIFSTLMFNILKNYMKFLMIYCFYQKP